MNKKKQKKQNNKLGEKQNPRQKNEKKTPKGAGAILPSEPGQTTPIRLSHLSYPRLREDFQSSKHFLVRMKSPTKQGKGEGGDFFREITKLVKKSPLEVRRQATL